MNNSRHLKNVLNYNIRKIAECPAIFCENPDKDFTRNRLLTFETPAASAFVQSRNQIKAEAFKVLFDRFNTKICKDKLYKECRFLAIDSSELPVSSYPYDEDTTLLRKGGTHKPYSAFHITASYDLLECTYDDLIIQDEARMDENDAFCQRIVQEIKIPEKSRRKYKYQINFTRSFHILREFLKKKGGNNPPVENLIAKEILPIHPGRSNTRNIKAKKAVCFNYRYD